jgi:hypothetical protein
MKSLLDNLIVWAFGGVTAALATWKALELISMLAGYLGAFNA